MYNTGKSTTATCMAATLIVNYWESLSSNWPPICNQEGQLDEHRRQSGYQFSLAGHHVLMRFKCHSSWRGTIRAVGLSGVGWLTYYQRCAISHGKPFWFYPVLNVELTTECEIQVRISRTVSHPERILHFLDSVFFKLFSKPKMLTNWYWLALGGYIYIYERSFV